MARARDARGRFVSSAAGGADETVVLGGDASGVENAAKRAIAAMRDWGNAAEKFGQKGTKSAESVKKFADEADRLEKVGRVLGGRFADLGGVIDDVSKALEVGVSKTTLAVLGFGAMAVAAAATTAAVVAFGAHVVSVTRNVEGLSKQLSDADRARLSPYITRVQEAERALVGFDKAVIRGEISMASLFAPTTTRSADAMAGLTDIAGQMLTKLQTPVDQAGSLGEFLLRYAGGSGGAFLGALYDSSATRGEALRQKTYGPEAPFGYQPPEKIYGPEAPDGYAPPPGPATGATSGGGFDPSTFALDGEVETVGPDDAMLAYVDLMLFQQREDEKTEALRVAEEERTALSAQAARDRQANEAQALAEYQAMAAQRAQIEAQTYAAIGQVTGAFFGFASDLLDNQTAETREARLEQFRAQQVVALAEAGVGAALAIVQGFAQLGPVGGAAAAVATGLVTGLQIATIASTEPQFHVGGTLAADERYANVRLRDNELAAFFTSQAQDRLGGPQAVEDIARTGRAVGGGDAYYFVLDGEIRKFRRFAEPAIMGQNDVRV